jgi:hypothetical protein
MRRLERMAKKAIPPPINTTTMMMSIIRPLFPPSSSSAGSIVATAVGAGAGALVAVAAGAVSAGAAAGFLVPAGFTMMLTLLTSSVNCANTRSIGSELPPPNGHIYQLPGQTNYLEQCTT